MLNCARCKINLLSSRFFKWHCVWNVLWRYFQLSTFTWRVLRPLTYNLIIPVQVTFSINTRAPFSQQNIILLAFIFFYFPKPISLGRKTPLFTSKSSFLARWARSAQRSCHSFSLFHPTMLVFPRSVHFQVKRLLLLLKRLLGARSQGSLSRSRT